MTESEVVAEAPDVSDLLREGEALSRGRNYGEALDRFNRAIAMDPSSSMAWYNRGVLLEGQRDAKGAKQSFTICLDLEPDHAPATANLAVLLERMGDAEGAGAMATRALTHYPDHPELLDIRRRCQTGQTVEPDLPVQRPTPTATWEDEHLTKAMDKAGVTDAQAVLEESSHHDTDGDGVLDQEELERAASVVAAQQHVQETMVEDDADATPPPVEAPPIVAEPEHHQPTLEDLVNQAKGELDAGHPKAAIGLLRDRLRTDGAEDIEAWITAAAMHRLNLEDHALGAAQHSIRIDDQRPEGWVLVGDVHAAKGETNAAIEAYTKALERGANDDVAARRWPLLSRNEHPDVWFEEAMTRLGPEAPTDDRVALAAWMLDLGEGEVTALEHLPDQPPTLPEAPELGAHVILLLANDAPRLRARAHSLQLQHLEAIGLWKAEVTKDSADGSAWTGMARALEAAGELEKAAKCHARAQQMSTSSTEQSMTPVTDEPSTEDAATHTVVDLSPAPEFQSPTESEASEDIDSAASLLLSAPAPEPVQTEPTLNPQVDLAAAALEATSNIAAPSRTTTPEQDAQQGREWFNRGTQLLEDKKYREALSCFDKSLSLLADDEEKVILVLNARGNCYYYMEDYPKCVDAYYQAMMIRPAQVRGQTLYNMGVAYAEMERYDDAIKCFEQGESRGLTPDEIALAKEQIRRCKILRKEKEKRAAKRR